MVVEARKAVTRKKGRVTKRGATRRQLLEVAGHLFDVKGYAGTSIRDIASAMDTSISNIYHYFGSKEGLWDEIHKNSVRQIAVRLREAIEGETDPVKQLRQLLTVHLKLADEFQRESRIFFVNTNQLNAPHTSVQRQIQRDVLEIYVSVLRRLRKEGHITLRQPMIMAFNILAVLNWKLRWYRADGKLSAAVVHKELMEFVLRGVGLPE